MLNNFIYSEEKQLFEELLNQGNVSDESIAFIEDTKEIWNRGTYFGNINLVKEDTNQNLNTNTIKLGSALQLTTDVIDVNPENIQITVLSTCLNFSLRTNKLYIGTGLILSTNADDPIIELNNPGIWIDSVKISSLLLSPELDIFYNKQLGLKYSSDFKVNPTEGLCLAKLLLEWDNLGSIVVGTESNPELQYVLYSNGLSDLLDYSTDYEIASIGNDQFRSLPKEDIVTFNELQYFTGLTKIEDLSFLYCSSLTSVTIPSNVTSIESTAFIDCYNLKNIAVVEDNANYDSRGGCNAIIHTSRNSLIRGGSNTIIPNNVIRIGSGAFYNCGNLTSITIPESVTIIDGNAFFNCSSLTSITIPEGVWSIGELAFYYCSRLATITCKATTPPNIANSYTFDGVDKSIPVYVPASSVEAYQSAEGWRNFTNIQPISE